MHTHHRQLPPTRVGSGPPRAALVKARSRRVLLTALLALNLAAPVAAQPPTSDPSVGAAYAAGWVARQVGPDGFIALPDDSPNVSATIEGALALAAAGVEEETFDAMVGWLQANVATVIAPYGTTSPGTIGYLLLIAQVAGIAPANFGGTDLPAALGATLGAYEPGLYGADDPTYDGVFRQSLAILGLVAAGQVVPAAARSWLQTQQCTAPAAAAGGWQGYRANPMNPCDAPDPVTFSGPDSNSTALAIQALAASSGSGVAAGLSFLSATQAPTAGWSYIAGGEDDPNSTALVIQAILAGGQDPATWTQGVLDPYDALLAWQIGCDGAAGDRGAFASPFSDGFPDLFATRQAVWGASGRPFPLGVALFGPTPDPCAPPAPTTTSGPGSPTTVPIPTAPAPITATPTFAG